MEKWTLRITVINHFDAHHSHNYGANNRERNLWVLTSVFVRASKVHYAFVRSFDLAKAIEGLREVAFLFDSDVFQVLR